jgi:hypothetical protein
MTSMPLMRASFRFAGIAGLCAALTVLSGCGIVSRPGTYVDPSGPRNGDGLLVDPQSGVPLPGQSDSGI